LKSLTETIDFTVIFLSKSRPVILQIFMQLSPGAGAYVVSVRPSVCLPVPCLRFSRNRKAVETYSARQE